MATYKLLDSYTVGSGGVSSVSFNNINQLYTDLKVVASVRGDAATVAKECTLSINGTAYNTSASYKELYGNGSTVSSASYSGLYPFYEDGSSATASTFANIEFLIPNYTSSNYKSISADSAVENNSTTAANVMSALLWSNSAPVTSLTLTPGSGNFAQYSTFELYGVSNQPATAAPAGTTTIGTAYSSGNTSANVPFTYSGTDASYFVATSSPDNLTATGTTSPLTVTGLTTGTAYTFTVKPYNFVYGAGTASSVSNSVTPYGDFVALATATVDSGGSASITFSNIPQNFKHLQLRGIASTNQASPQDIYATLNSDSGSNYSYHQLIGNGGATYAGATTSTNHILVAGNGSAITGYYSSFVMDLLNYSSSSKNKTARSLLGFDTNYTGGANWNKMTVGMASSLWMSTSPVNSLTITLGSGDFAQYSQLELYGVN